MSTLISTPNSLDQAVTKELFPLASSVSTEQVWDRLSDRQQQRVSTALVRICRAIAQYLPTSTQEETPDEHNG